jgi:hypothetical protein
MLNDRPVLAVPRVLDSPIQENVRLGGCDHPFSTRTPSGTSSGPMPDSTQVVVRVVALLVVPLVAGRFVVLWIGRAALPSGLPPVAVAGGVLRIRVLVVADVTAAAVVVVFLSRRRRRLVLGDDHVHVLGDAAAAPLGLVVTKAVVVMVAVAMAVTMVRVAIVLVPPLFIVVAVVVLHIVAPIAPVGRVAAGPVRTVPQVVAGLRRRPSHGLWF